MRWKFGSAGAVCSIKEISGPQNQRVHTVLKASKTAGASGGVPKICGCVHCTRCNRANVFPDLLNEIKFNRAFKKSACKSFIRYLKYLCTFAPHVCNLGS